MALSAWQLSRTSMVLWEGDSLSDPALPYQMLNPAWEAMTNAYVPSTAGMVASPRLPSSASVVRPNIVRKGVNGSTIAQIDSRIAAELAVNAYTHVVVCCGTNERAVLRADTQTAIASLVSKFTTEKVLVIGPYAWGEKWPTGENDIAGADDARLDETEIDLVDGFAGYANSLVIGLRNGGGSTATTGLYLTTMPPLNTPGPGASIGPYTVDGAHFNPLGRATVYDIISPFITFG